MPLLMQGGQQSSQPLYGQPLFPMGMFPSFSPPLQAPQPAKTVTQESHATGDELVELGALLALLKLAFG